MYDSVHTSKVLIKYISDQPIKPEMKQLPDGYIYFVITHENISPVGYA